MPLFTFISPLKSAIIYSNAFIYPAPVPYVSVSSFRESEKQKGMELAKLELLTVQL